MKILATAKQSLSLSKFLCKFFRYKSKLYQFMIWSYYRKVSAASRQIGRPVALTTRYCQDYIWYLQHTLNTYFTKSDWLGLPLYILPFDREWTEIAHLSDVPYSDMRFSNMCYWFVPSESNQRSLDNKIYVKHKFYLNSAVGCSKYRCYSPNRTSAHT